MKEGRALAKGEAFTLDGMEALGTIFKVTKEKMLKEKKVILFMS